MPKETKTCPGRIWNWLDKRHIPCNRPLYDHEHCICHSEKPDKDRDQFKTEVQKQLDRDDYQDFNGFVFPKDFSFSHAKFTNSANFDSAKFAGDANFNNAEFGGTASFLSAEFSGEADFGIARFVGDANFSETEFNGETNFNYAEFGGDVNFVFAMFDGEANFITATFAKTADFNGIMLSKEITVKFDGEENEKDRPVFQGNADFTNIRIPEGAEFSFRKINLSKCEFLETDLTKIEFTDVTWAKTGGFGKWFKTNAVYDAVKTVEKDIEYDYKLIAQLYRRLQINYVDNCHYTEAGDFHIGEQEMVRKGKKPVSRFFCTNMIYKIISNYGESFMRPFLWLLFVLLLFPAIFLYSGINIAPPNQQEDKIEYTVNYEFSPNPKDCFLFTSDYLDAFTINLSFISFNRNQVSKRLHSHPQVLIVYLESVLVIVLISFFVLALRRSYKRKI